jgi:hypothetical protein
MQIPDDFILFSDAISRLGNGMWGGLQRPAPVVAIKRNPGHKTKSIGFAGWKEQAGRSLSDSANRRRRLPHLSPTVVRAAEAISASVRERFQSNLRARALPRPQAQVKDLRSRRAAAFACTRSTV